MVDTAEVVTTAKGRTTDSENRKQKPEKTSGNGGKQTIREGERE
jgi:hypothetical protein